jgi:hypothetical protein
MYASRKAQSSNIEALRSALFTAQLRADEAAEAKLADRQPAELLKEIARNRTTTLTATGDDAMHMRMMSERHPPRVQHHRDPDLRAEMIGIGAEYGASVGHG